MTLPCSGVHSWEFPRVHRNRSINRAHEKSVWEYFGSSLSLIHLMLSPSLLMLRSSVTRRNTHFTSISVHRIFLFLMSSSLCLIGRILHCHLSAFYGSLELIIVLDTNNKLCWPDFHSLVSPIIYDSTRAAALDVCASTPLSDLTASEPVRPFPTRMKKCFPMHPSRCLDLFPLVSSPISPHVSSNNCTIFLPDAEEEFHDNHEARTIDDTLIVDPLQLVSASEWSLQIPQIWTRRGYHSQTQVVCVLTWHVPPSRVCWNSSNVWNLARPKLEICRQSVTTNSPTLRNGRLRQVQHEGCRTCLVTSLNLIYSSSLCCT